MWSALLSLAAVPALAQAFGIPDDNRMVQEPGLLRFPLAVSEGAPIVKNITKRQSDISLESQQTGWFYTIDLVMGTPGQTVKVNFDTGSAELWVNAQCETSSDPEFCATFPRFTGSSTLVDLQSQSTITYGSGSVDIEYAYDFVSIGGECYCLEPSTKTNASPLERCQDQPADFWSWNRQRDSHCWNHGCRP